MNLEEIKLLVENERYQEALDKFESLLQESPERTSEILRARTYAFAMSGDYDSALLDYETIFKMIEGTIGDYYQAGFHALNAKQFSKASEWFCETLFLGKTQNETWFESASHFYLSYTQMELGNYEDAIQSLDKAVSIESDVGMPIPQRGMCNNRQLREEIQRRMIKL